MIAVGHAYQFQQGWREIEVLHETGYTIIFWQLAGPVQDQGNMNVALVQAMMVKIAELLVEYFAMIGGHNHQRILLNWLQRFEDTTQVMVHIRGLAVVEVDHVFNIGDAGHPFMEVPFEWLPGPGFVHAMVVDIIGIAAFGIEFARIGWWR